MSVIRNLSSALITLGLSGSVIGGDDTRSMPIRNSSDRTAGAHDQDRTIALDDQGWWEVNDFSIPAERDRILVVDQYPVPGTMHRGLGSPVIEIQYIDLENLGEGPRSRSWPQRLVDETPPVLDVRLSSDLEPTESPFGVRMFIGPAVSVHVIVEASDAVDPDVVPTACWFDEEIMEDTPIALHWNPGGYWENDPENDPLVLTQIGNTIQVRASDASGNEETWEQYFELQPDAFYGAGLEIIEYQINEVGEGEFEATGRLRVTSSSFDPGDVHPDSLVIRFMDDNGLIEPIVHGVANDCCDDPTGPQRIRVMRSGESLEFEFIEFLPAEPQWIQVFGLSTWPEREFSFVCRTEAEERLRLGTEEVLDHDTDDEEEEEEEPPAVECQARGFRVPGILCNDVDGDGGYCADQNAPGSFYSYSFAQLTVDQTITIGRAEAEDRCAFNRESAVASCFSDQGEMHIMVTPANCAVGPLTLSGRPGATVECSCKKGSSGSLVGIQVTHATGNGMAAGGVKCIEKNSTGGVGLPAPGGGLSFPLVMPTAKEDKKDIVATPPLLREVECGGGSTMFITVAGGVGAAADDTALMLLDWTRARADAKISNVRVNAKMELNARRCDNDEPVTAQVSWR